MFAHAVMNIYWWILIKSLAYGGDDTVQEASSGIYEILYSCEHHCKVLWFFYQFVSANLMSEAISKTAVKQYVPLDTNHYLQVVLQARWLLSLGFFK